jgi:hypothetical protein
MALYFRGPINLKQIAVYTTPGRAHQDRSYPESSQSSKDGLGDGDTVTDDSFDTDDQDDKLEEREKGLERRDPLETTTAFVTVTSGIVTVTEKVLPTLSSTVTAPIIVTSTVLTTVIVGGTSDGSILLSPAKSTVFVTVTETTAGFTTFVYPSMSTVTGLTTRTTTVTIFSTIDTLGVSSPDPITSTLALDPITEDGGLYEGTISIESSFGITTSISSTIQTQTTSLSTSIPSSSPGPSDTLHQGVIRQAYYNAAQQKAQGLVFFGKYGSSGSTK